MNDRLLGAVEPEVAEVLRRLPAAWLTELGADDAFLVTPALAEVLERHAAEAPPGQDLPSLWQAVKGRSVGGTPFADIRMEAMAGPVCAVASPVAAAAWFSWLPIGALLRRPTSAPLVLVLHDVDRRARVLRDALGPWAEGTGTFVLVPEIFADPGTPGGDVAYAAGPAAAATVLGLVDELAARIEVALPRVVVLAVGTGCGLVPALQQAAPTRVAGCVLLSPDSSAVLAALQAPGTTAEAYPGSVVVLAGGADTARSLDGAADMTGLGAARRVADAFRRGGSDVELDVLPGSDGRVLAERVEVATDVTLPTAILHAATRWADALLRPAI